VPTFARPAALTSILFDLTSNAVAVAPILKVAAPTPSRAGAHPCADSNSNSVLLNFKAAALFYKEPPRLTGWRPPLRRLCLGLVLNFKAAALIYKEPPPHGLVPTLAPTLTLTNSVLLNFKAAALFYTRSRRLTGWRPPLRRL